MYYTCTNLAQTLRMSLSNTWVYLLSRTQHNIDWKCQVLSKHLYNLVTSCSNSCLFVVDYKNSKIINWSSLADDELKKNPGFWTKLKFYLAKQISFSNAMFARFL